MEHRNGCIFFLNKFALQFGKFEFTVDPVSQLQNRPRKYFQAGLAGNGEKTLATTQYKLSADSTVYLCHLPFAARVETALLRRNGNVLSNQAVGPCTVSIFCHSSHMPLYLVGFSLITLAVHG
jgi:hypothetical protein